MASAVGSSFILSTLVMVFAGLCLGCLTRGAK
jgi:hypothetical protein